jgi:hypothetical protein
MAYTLQAIIGRDEEMRSSAPDDLPTVGLTDGFSLWAIDSDYQDAHEIPFLPLTDEGLAEVPLPVVELAGRLSECIYIGAEYFGGDGGQASVFYRSGVQQGSINIGDSATNEALRAFGVVTKPSMDEFDSVGLSRERNTDNWRNNQAEQGVAPQPAARSESDFSGSLPPST